MNLRDPSPRLRRWLVFAFAMLALSGFAALAGEMRDDDTRHWDQAALLQAQQWRAAHPLVEAIMRELSSLGSTPVMTLFRSDPIAFARCTRRVAVASSVGLGALARPAPRESRPTLAVRAPPSARFTRRSTSLLSTQRSTKKRRTSQVTANGVPMRKSTNQAVFSLPVVSST